MNAKGCREPDPVRLAAHPPAGKHPAVMQKRAGLARFPRQAGVSVTRPRVDQGKSGSCTWCSTAIALFVAFAAMGKPLTFVPSQRDGYADTRALERARNTPPGQKLDPLKDQGADLEDVFDAMATFGVGPMHGELTPDGRFCDIWTDEDTGGTPPGNVNDEPDGDALVAQSRTRIKVDVNAHRVDLAGGDGIPSMLAALAANQPILACGWVSTSFEDATSGTVVGAQDPNDPNGGGHAFWISQYRTTDTGNFEFLLENSWGRLWALAGAVWVSEAFIKGMWAAYVLAPQIIQEAA